jgi:hypothetical protein
MPQAGTFTENKRLRELEKAKAKVAELEAQGCGVDGRIEAQHH